MQRFEWSLSQGVGGDLARPSRHWQPTPAAGGPETCRRAGGTFRDHHGRSSGHRSAETSHQRRRSTNNGTGPRRLLRRQGLTDQRCPSGDLDRFLRSRTRRSRRHRNLQQMLTVDVDLFRWSVVKSVVFLYPVYSIYWLWNYVICERFMSCNLCYVYRFKAPPRSTESPPLLRENFEKKILTLCRKILKILFSPGFRPVPHHFCQSNPMQLHHVPMYY